MSPIRLVLALLLFAGITIFAEVPASAPVDRAATVWLQRAAPAPDGPTGVLIFLADAEVVIPVLGLAGLILIAGGNRSRGWDVLWVAAGAAVVSLLAVVGKHVIVHPGPPPDLVRRAIGPQVNIATTPWGYPSGHTMRTTFVAGTVLRRAPWAAGTLVAAVIASLVYLGDHWTTEVLGGLCLAWACVELIRWARPGLR